jgi:hypothetical protein
MNEIVVTFRGLCAFIDRNRWFEVYLPNGAVVPESERGECPVDPMPHVATLAIPVSDLDLSLGATTWHPDFVVHHDHVQLACWQVTGRPLTFVQPAAHAPVWPRDDRKGTFDLAASHPGYQVRSKAELTALGYGVLTLTGGRIRSGRRRQFEMGQAAGGGNGGSADSGSGHDHGQAHGHGQAAPPPTTTSRKASNGIRSRSRSSSRRASTAAAGSPRSRARH